MFNQKVRQGWDHLIAPVGRAAARSRVSPDAITAAGVLIQAYAAFLIVAGAIVAAALVSLVAAAADVMDGAVAKARGMGGKFGAVLDSTTDRLTDALLLLPIAWLYGVSPDIPKRDEPWVAAAALTALVASFLVSYIKARAESLGFDCNVGIAERAERVGLIILGLLLDIIPIVLIVLALLSTVTFVQRLVHVRRQAARVP